MDSNETVVFLLCPAPELTLEEYAQTRQGLKEEDQRQEKQRKRGRFV